MDVSEEQFGKDVFSAIAIQADVNLLGFFLAEVGRKYGFVDELIVDVETEGSKLVDLLHGQGEPSLEEV